jgi:hypothetical protein
MNSEGVCRPQSKLLRTYTASNGAATWHSAREPRIMLMATVIRRSSFWTRKIDCIASRNSVSETDPSICSISSGKWKTVTFEKRGSCSLSGTDSP